MDNLPELEKIKEKIKNTDILQDMKDYADSSNSLPRFSASSMTNCQLVEVIQFLTEEIKRLNVKVWNLMQIKQNELS